MLYACVQEYCLICLPTTHCGQAVSRRKGVAKGSLHLFRHSWEKAGVRVGALDLTNTAVWTGSCN